MVLGQALTARLLHFGIFVGTSLGFLQGKLRLDQFVSTTVSKFLFHMQEDHTLVLTAARGVTAEVVMEAWRVGSLMLLGRFFFADWSWFFQDKVPSEQPGLATLCPNKVSRKHKSPDRPSRICATLLLLPSAWMPLLCHTPDGKLTRRSDSYH